MSKQLDVFREPFLVNDPDGLSEAEALTADLRYFLRTLPDKRSSSKSLKYREDQLRDDHGRFASEGSDSLGPTSIAMLKLHDASFLSQRDLQFIAKNPGREFHGWMLADGRTIEVSIGETHQSILRTIYKLAPSEKLASEHLVRFVYAPDRSELNIQFWGEITKGQQQEFRSLLGNLDNPSIYWDAFANNSSGSTKRLVDVVSVSQGRERKYREDQLRDDHGRFANEGADTVAGETEEGRIGNQHLYNVVGGPDYSSNPDEMSSTSFRRASRLKFANMQVLGSSMRDQAEGNPALTAQLEAAGNIPINREIVDRLYYNHTFGGGKDLTTLDYGAEYLAHALQKTWSNSASDENPTSLAMQLAVAEKFGLDHSGIDKLANNAFYPDEDTENLGIKPRLGVFPEPQELVKAIAESPAMKTFVNDVYQRTQDSLKELGIKEVTLYRGMNWGRFEGKDFTANPLSSFSLSTETANEFAHGEHGGPNASIIVTTVPANRIFSIPTTGPGCLREEEVVIIGGPIRVDKWEPQRSNLYPEPE